MPTFRYPYRLTAKLVVGRSPCNVNFGIYPSPQIRSPEGTVYNHAGEWEDRPSDCQHQQEAVSVRCTMMCAHLQGYMACLPMQTPSPYSRSWFRLLLHARPKTRMRASSADATVVI